MSYNDLLYTDTDTSIFRLGIMISRHIIESISALSIHGFRIIAEWVRSCRFFFVTDGPTINFFAYEKIVQPQNSATLFSHSTFQILGCMWSDLCPDRHIPSKLFGNADFFFGISHSTSMLTDVQRLNCQRFSHGAFFQVLTIFWSSKSLKSLRGALYPLYKNLCFGKK